MLLRQEVTDGVEVLSVRGPVTAEDTQPLRRAVLEALTHEAYAVVLDLEHAGTLPAETCSALADLPARPESWPPASLVVSPLGGGPQVPGWLSAAGVVQALQQLERRAQPRTRIDVDHSDQGPGQARAAVTARAQELGLPDDVCDDVVLLVSELVTNAIRYASPPVRLELQSCDQDVVVTVTDGSCEHPTARQADDQAEGGRGMLLVDRLASDHGVRVDAPGKAVWARVRRSPDS